MIHSSFKDKNNCFFLNDDVVGNKWCQETTWQLLAPCKKKLFFYSLTMSTFGRRPSSQLQLSRPKAHNSWHILWHRQWFAHCAMLCASLIITCCSVSVFTPFCLLSCVCTLYFLYYTLYRSFWSVLLTSWMSSWWPFVQIEVSDAWAEELAPGTIAKHGVWF